MRNWAAWVGMKYGTLTIEKFLGYEDARNTYFLVRCDCGKTKKVKTGEFLRGKAKSCGLLNCKRKVARLLDLPQPPKSDPEPNREITSAIEARIKPKYFCKAVNAELEEWLCSGDTDYLYKAMAVIRAEIDNELQHEIDKLIAEIEG